MGLPPSLEELDILLCSEVLNDQCRMLTTSKLKVGINFQDGNWLVVVLLSMSLYLHKRYRYTSYEVYLHRRS
uniref:Uncharacterized protein n=1 Tax=Aegilops tauschii subsp. strangulata TaxID=200361 RepID=A0A452XGV9_AEGTS